MAQVFLIFGSADVGAMAEVLSNFGRQRWLQARRWVEVEVRPEVIDEVILGLMADDSLGAA